MLLSEDKITMAKKVLEEFDDMENQRREEQYENVLQAFRESFNEGDIPCLYDDDILYDEVRELLEKVGFKVRTVTSDSCGSVAYSITKKEDFVPKKDVEILR